MSIRNDIQGLITITGEDMQKLCMKYVGLPAAFHVVLGKIKLDETTSILTCKFNASTEGTPEAPPEV